MKLLRSFFTAAQIGLLSAGLLFSTGCMKNNNDDYLADLQKQADEAKIADEATIQKYLADKKITKYQKLPTGTYVVPDTTALGSGDLPKVGQKLTVSYVGQFFDGRVFDTSVRNGTDTPYTFVLGTNDIIQGWNDGLATMRKGAKATLLIPSARAYSVYANGPIPPNTPLRFEVTLVDIQ